ncbi:MAG: hypothetical protein F6K30_30400, partial [Cyanothece sp. SIO2G6]|nr:hypothetical protein [Cyanothece sp. SIO2G6]
MVIPKLDITQWMPDIVNGQAAQLGQIARSILTALSTYPYYIVVHGYPPDKDRDNLLNLARA